MNYEQAYKDALERAKMYYESAKEAGDYSAVARYENIFPELHESEDERMLREFNDYLCEEIECRTNDIRDEKDRRTLNVLCYVLKKVDAWLTKQKESLHIHESCKENGDSFTDKDERIRKWILEKVQGYATSGIPISSEIEMANKALAWLEEQKDKNCLACDQHLKGYIAGRKTTKEEKQKEQVTDESEKIAAAYQLGRSDERKQKEQNPAEPQDYSNLSDFERAIHRGFLCAGVENVPVTIIKETAQDCLAQIKPVEIKIDNPNIQKVDPDVKVTTSDSSASGYDANPNSLIYERQSYY